MSGAELCERQFQSTPPARGRLEKILLRLKKTAISIHAPREGGATAERVPRLRCQRYFNPRPREGGATGEVELVAGVVLKFQSTPPRRGATRCSSDLRWVPQNFNPRPARGGDRYDRAASLTAWYFNPRPREGGRLLWMSTRPTVLIFQSTPPRGGATFGFGPLTLTQKLFQSTPPRGGATKALDKLEEEMEFQSTPPRGGATLRWCS